MYSINNRFSNRWRNVMVLRSVIAVLLAISVSVGMAHCKCDKPTPDKSKKCGTTCPFPSK